MWYYAEGETAKGPVSGQALAELYRSGAVIPTTPVRREGSETWSLLEEVRSELPLGQNSVISADGRAFCTHCGGRFGATELVAIAGQQVCAACKPLLLQRIREGGTILGGRRYAGFWIRVVAAIVDGMILVVVNVAMVISVSAAGITRRGTDAESLSAALAASAVLNLISVLIGLLYETLFLVRFGATPGKMAVGARVIRADGRPIGYGLAIGRYFAKWVSGIIIGIGYLVCAWDDEKRALHDRMCDTRVVRS
jgi:uncharacterized RDD family membrane protein YckC